MQWIKSVVSWLNHLNVGETDYSFLEFFTRCCLDDWSFFNLCLLEESKCVHLIHLSWDELVFCCQLLDCSLVFSGIHADNDEPSLDGCYHLILT